MLWTNTTKSQRLVKGKHWRKNTLIQRRKQTNKQKSNNNNNNNNNNSILCYLCAESTAIRPITNTAQCRYK
jgi:hypothetical protein